MDYRVLVGNAHLAAMLSLFMFTYLSVSGEVSEIYAIARSPLKTIG
jgi:hypothetical protein